MTQYGNPVILIFSYKPDYILPDKFWNALSILVPIENVLFLKKIVVTSFIYNMIDTVLPAIHYTWTLGFLRELLRLWIKV